MGRTQEQLIRTGKENLPDPYEGTFSFPNWSDWRLELRLTDLMETAQLPHNSERRSGISRELAHIVFEMNWRNTNE